MNRNSIFFVAALAGIAFTAPAMAEDVVVKHQALVPEGVPSVLVRYNDLDLDSQAGRDSLTTRLDSAVRRVCGNADLRNLDEFSGMITCREESTGRAYAARDELFAQHIAARQQGTSVASASAPQTMAVFAQR